MQRYLSPGEAGEVVHEPPFFAGSRCLTSPRRADGVEVALHILIGAAALLKEGRLPRLIRPWLILPHELPEDDEPT